jgi:hydroxymethylbilane synthase
LKRLGLSAHIAARLDPSDMPPAVSQGAIGVCARVGDEPALQWLRSLDHAATRVAVTAERALLRRIEGGCQVPLGALASVTGADLHLYAVVCALDGSVSIEREDQAPVADAVALGARVAEHLLARGAGELIAQQRKPMDAELP